MKRNYGLIMAVMAITAIPILTSHETLACDQIAMTATSGMLTVDANSPVMKTSVFESDVGTNVAETIIYLSIFNVNGNDDVGVCGEQFVATAQSANLIYMDASKNSDVNVGSTDINAADTRSPRYPLKTLIVDDDTTTGHGSELTYMRSTDADGS